MASNATGLGWGFGLACCLALAGACGDAESGTEANGSAGGTAGAQADGATDAPAMTELEAAKLLTAPFCKGRELCNPISFSHDFASQQDCIERLGKPEFFFGPGTTTTPEQLAACAATAATAAEAATSCEEWEAFLANLSASSSCLSVGSKTGGESCISDLQCATYCKWNVPCGTCSSSGFVALGAACSLSDRCEVGAWCSEGICTKQGALGAACKAANDSCQAYLVCLSGTCSKPLGAGQPCPGWGCDHDLRCNQQTNVCEPLGTSLLGEPCGMGLPDGSTSGCIHGTRCRTAASSPTGVCVGALSLGSPCTDDYVLSSGCETPGFCLDGTCRLLSLDGCP